MTMNIPHLVNNLPKCVNIKGVLNTAMKWSEKAEGNGIFQVEGCGVLS